MEHCVWRWMGCHGCQSCLQAAWTLYSRYIYIYIHFLWLNFSDHCSCLCEGATARTYGTSSQFFTQPIVLNNVQCTGIEERLIDCEARGGRTCTHREDAGVACLVRTGIHLWGGGYSSHNYNSSLWEKLSLAMGAEFSYGGWGFSQSYSGCWWIAAMMPILTPKLMWSNTKLL